MEADNNLEIAYRSTGKIEITLQINPAIVPHFMAIFEIEILRGVRDTLEDGRVEMKFEIDAESAKRLRQAVTIAIMGNPNKRQH